MTIFCCVRLFSHLAGLLKFANVGLLNMNEKLYLFHFKEGCKANQWFILTRSFECVVVSIVTTYTAASIKTNTLECTIIGK